MTKQPLFKDRSEAGRQLADALQAARLANPVLVALSNDGITVGFEIAHRLGLPLDVLIIQTISAPGDPRQMLGVVVDGPEPHLVVDEETAQRLHPPPGYLDAERHHQLSEVERRHRMYFGEDAPDSHDHRGRDVILVDDGSAATASLQAAIRALREQGAQSIRLALPVDRHEITESLEAELDGLVCLMKSEAGAVAGGDYAVSEAISDQEAVRLLREARKLDRMLH